MKKLAKLYCSHPKRVDSDEFILVAKPNDKEVTCILSDEYSVFICNLDTENLVDIYKHILLRNRNTLIFYYEDYCIKFRNTNYGDPYIEVLRVETKNFNNDEELSIDIDLDQLLNLFERRKYENK
jgi:hypothetical protein